MKLHKLKIVKKTIAMCLAICMVAGMIPITALSTPNAHAIEPENNTLLFDFKLFNDTYGDDIKQMKYSDTSDTWEFDNCSDSLKAAGYACHAPFGLKFESYAVGEYGSFRIKIKEPGTYTPTQTYITSGGGGTYNVYLTPIGTPEDQRRSDTYLLGEVNCFNATETKKVLNAVEIKTAGEYYLSFEAKAKGSWGACMYMTSFELAKSGSTNPPTDPVPPTPTEPQPLPLKSNYFYNFQKIDKYWADPTDANWNKAIDINTIIDLEMTRSGSPTEIHPNSTKGKSDIWKFISVSDNAVVNYGGNALGVSIMKKDAASDGIGAMCSFKIAVLSPGVYTVSSVNPVWVNGMIADLFVAPDYAKDPIDPSYLVGTLDSYSATPNYDAINPVKDMEFATGVYTVTYKVKGINPSATPNAYNHLFEIKGLKLDLVTPGTLNYNFQKIDKYWADPVNENWNQAVDVTTVDTYEKTRPGSPTEIHPTVQKCMTDNWMFKQVSSDATMGYGGNALGISLLKKDATFNGVGASCSFQIVVPREGLYTPVFKGPLWANGMIADIFIAPATATDVSAEEYLVGTVDSYSATQNLDAETTLPNKQFTAGVNVVTFKVKGINASGTPNAYNHLFEIKALKLVPGALQTKIVGDAIGTLNINDSKRVELKYDPGTGATESLTVTGVTAAANPENIVNAKIEKQADGKNYLVLTGTAAGTTKVTVSATVKGKPVTGVFDVTVSSTVSAPKTVINFLDTRGVSTWDASLDIHGWALNKEKTSSKLQTSDDLVRFASYGMQIQSYGLDEIVALEFNVQQNGIYDVSMQGGRFGLGGYGGIYVDGIYLGQYDFYDVNGISDAPLQNLRSINLTAGTHELIIKPMKKGTGGYMNMYPKKFTFQGVSTASALTEVMPTAIQTTIKAGRSTVASATVKLANGAQFDLLTKYDGSADTGYTVSYESKNPSIATIDQKGKITGVSEGAATISATVTLNGVTKTGEMSITVEPRPALSNLMLDFKKDFGVSAYNASIDVHGWELNREKTSPALLGSVANRDGFRFQSYYGIQVQSSYNEQASMDFEIPEDGDYLISFKGGNFDAGGYGYLYIDDKFVGEYDFNSPVATAEGPTIKLRSLHLSAGMHTIVYKSVRPSEAGRTHMYPAMLSFTGAAQPDDLSEATVTLDKVDIAVGETAKAIGGAKLASGSVFIPRNKLDGSVDTEYTITYRSADPTIATVDASGVIKGIKPGKTQIFADTTKNGDIKSKAIDININNKELDKIVLVKNTDGFYVGYPVKLDVKAFYNDGTEIPQKDFTVTFTSENIQLLDIDKSVASPKAPGKVKLAANINFNGIVKSQVFDIDVQAIELGQVAVGGDKPFLSLNDSEGIKLTVTGTNNNGSKADLTGATLSYQTLCPEIAIVTPAGLVLPVSTGHGQIEATVTLNDVTIKGIYEVTVGSGKTKSTIYTTEKREAAQENAEKYEWAKQMKESAVNLAEPMLKQMDDIYNMVPYEGIPRSTMVGLRNDPTGYICPYCGKELRSEYGYYPWIINPFTSPWKIQCPSCRRKFPSNDFESYYKSGLDQKGQFIPEKAKQNGQQYLKNVLYPEKEEHVDPTTGKLVNEGVHNWGVDDGFGYVTGKMISNNVAEVRTFVPYYMHWGLWYRQSATIGKATVPAALLALRDAYLYTGDIRYGRAGAILIDRVADIYPSYDLNPWAQKYANSDGGYYMGKVLGNIWETDLSSWLTTCYDAFYPAMDDEKVVSYLSKQAKEKGLANPKSSAAFIRENCETGILREINKACRSARIYGNFGMHQKDMAQAAVALDTLPETGEMIDWVFRAETPESEIWSGKNDGGGVLPQLVDAVNRDGTGNEVGSSYNSGWLANIADIAGVLAGYKTYAAADLFKNPKFVKMFTGVIPQILVKKYTAQIGDYSSTAQNSINGNLSEVLLGYKKTGDPELAKLVYFLSNSNVDNLHDDIFTKNPQSLGPEIKKIVENQGEYKFDSVNRTGFGFAVMRDGEYRKGTGSMKTLDTQRDFWMFYGATDGVHPHSDKLNLGFDAYGFNMAPDNGYPTSTGPDPERMQWNRTTLSHNTVVVNETEQGASTDATPYHFDTSDKVQIMDVDAPQVYSGKASIYRRTVVMVDVDDEVSYGVDFFRVKGGTDHTYSFHSQSDEVIDSQGLNFVKQVDANGNYVGSYAGPDIKWGPDPDSDPTQWFPPLKYPKGYTWLRNVRKDTAPQSGSFSVTFKQKDFRGAMPYPMDLNLRMTMLNDFTPNEVALAQGVPPQVGNNPIKGLDYILVRRKGENLDTLFTTVFEPYKDNRYLSDMTAVQTTIVTGTQGSNDAVRAIKVTHTNGKVDYIIYATNNTVEYRIDDKFNFRGFVGVLSYYNDEVTYSYLNDGDIIGDRRATPAYTGKVVDFTKDLSFDNTITVKCDTDFDPSILNDKYVYVDNDKVLNGSYRIDSASRDASGNLVLNLGNTTLIRKYKDAKNMAAGYVYNIAADQTVRIPLPDEINNKPIFTPVPKQTAEVGSEFKLRVSAKSPIDKPLTYTGKYMPYGANFDPKTQTITWIPGKGQVGGQYITIEATDGVNSSLLNIEVNVYGDSHSGGNGGNVVITPPPEVKPPVVTPEQPKPEKDEKSFAVKKDAEVKAETKLGSVVFPEGSFDTNGTGKVSIEKNSDKLDVNVTVGGKDITPSAPVKVSVNYKPAESMKDPNCIIVKDPNGNIIPSGKFDNGALAFYTEDLGSFTVEYNPKSFNDLINHAWANDAVTRLAARGIINGITATTYNPAANITRADFTTLVVRTFGLKADSKASFHDVDTNAYYADAVSIAKELGIVGGVDDKNFAPTAQITREDMMVIVSRAIDKVGLKLSDETRDDFADMDVVSGYAKEAVETLTATGIVAGSKGKVNPKGKTTRAEVAVILDRLVFINR